MTLQEFEQKLKNTELPVSYRKFKKPNPVLPVVVWFVGEERHRGADYENMITEYDIIVELYSDRKDLKNESKLDDILSEFDFVKYESYIEDESMLQVAYHITLITLKEEQDGKGK